MDRTMPLPAAEVTQFYEQGFLVARGLLDIEGDIAPVVQEYEAKLATILSQWHEQGLIADDLQDRSFGEKIIYIIQHTDLDYAQPLDISLPQANVTEATPFHTGPAILGLLRNPRLLDAVEQFVGPEIYSNPVQHVRIKPPESALPAGFGDNALITRTPWHQDLGVIDEEADEATILTVWIAITEATEANGCMAVLPESNHGELALHCPVNGNTVAIPRAHLPGEPVPLPMKPGDVLFMTSTTMHTSLHNVSDGIRWSFDLRYNPIGEKTGRPWFPGFVARSRANPESELRDAEQWGRLWQEARRKIALNGDPEFNRWDADAIGCA